MSTKTEDKHYLGLALVSKVAYYKELYIEYGHAKIMKLTVYLVQKKKDEPQISLLES